VPPREFDVDACTKSARVRMRPFVASDVEFLYWLSACEPTASRWRFAGRTPIQSRFLQTVDAGVTAHWIFVSNAGDRIGYACLYQYDPVDGVAYYAIVLRSEVWNSLSSFDCMVLSVDYIFDHWDLRFIYAELTETTYATVASGDGRWFERIGVLKSHQYHRHTYVDAIVIQIDRALWQRRSAPYRRLLHGGSESRSRGA
jgi:hypothetical protein